MQEVIRLSPDTVTLLQGDGAEFSAFRLRLKDGWRVVKKPEHGEDFAWCRLVAFVRMALDLHGPQNKVRTPHHGHICMSREPAV